MMLNLGALEKDRAGVDTGLLTIAKNCYPTSVGWGPMPSLSEFGSDALPAGCKGLFFAKDASGAYQVFTGTATKLYKLASGAWTDYSRSTGGNYTVSAGNLWRSAQWGSLLIVVNGTDAPQVLDIDSGATNFTALAGSPPVAFDISIVGDFVFLLDATNRRRLIWCGTTGPNTATSWTVGTDLCDEYIAPDGGNISCPPLLGEYGLFIQDQGVARRVILQPGDPTAAFRFEKLEGVRGGVAGYSYIPANGRIYYMAEDGIYALGVDGANAPIGTERENQDFRENSDANRLNQVLGFADPYSTRIYWAYYSSESATVYDRLLGYDWLRDRFFFVEQSAPVFAPIVTPGVTLDQLDGTYPNLDLMPVSLDARQFQGGRPTIGAVTASGKLALLSGPYLSPTWRISGVHLIPGLRAKVIGAYLIGELGSATWSLRIGKREHGGAAPEWVGPFTPSARTGNTQPLVSARIHEFEITLTGTDWTLAQALQTTEIRDGEQ